MSVSCNVLERSLEISIIVNQFSKQQRAKHFKTRIILYSYSLVEKQTNLIKISRFRARALNCVDA